MTPDQLEFAISQYLDGTLPPLERQALEQRLAGDSQARETFESYRRLQEAMLTAPARPQVRWDRLAAHLSSAVANQEMPVRHYRLYRRVAGGVAVAALLLIAFGITVRVYLAMQDLPDPGTFTVLVGGGQVDFPAEMLVQEVAIGPARGVYEAIWTDAEGVLSRPSRVIIASAREAGQDPDPLPY